MFEIREKIKELGLWRFLLALILFPLLAGGFKIYEWYTDWKDKQKK